MGWENSNYQAPGSRTTRTNRTNRTELTPFQVRDSNGQVELLSGSPPDYYSSERQIPPPPRRNMTQQPSAPWWNPRYWRKRTWAIAVTIFIIILVIVIVVPVEVVKANRYPDYTALNYSLADECRSLWLLRCWSVIMMD